MTLKEVVIEAEKDKNVSGMQMGLEKLDIKTMRQVPTAFGETDILRVVMTLPGVKSVGEGSTGLNVRGGATDQNLILFNDATIYNPSHLFGFFSAFNPDILQGVELYKSAIPAKYGGRLSSVLDITTREGNKKKFAGSGGIGPLTSRLTLEGPAGERQKLLHPERPRQLLRLDSETALRQELCQKRGRVLRPHGPHQPRNQRQELAVCHGLLQHRPVSAGQRHHLPLLQPKRPA